jgi:hypothetical protein
MRTLYYFRSTSGGVHAFTDDETGSKLPADQGPWRLVRAVDPQQGWTDAAEISAVDTGIRMNGYFLADASGELTFGDLPVKPGA